MNQLCRLTNNLNPNKIHMSNNLIFLGDITQLTQHVIGNTGGGRGC